MKQLLIVRLDKDSIHTNLDQIKENISNQLGDSAAHYTIIVLPFGVESVETINPFIIPPVPYNPINTPSIPSPPFVPNSPYYPSAPVWTCTCQT